MKQIELVEKINKFGNGTIVDQISFLISSNYFLVPLFLLVSTLIVIYEREKRLFILGTMFLALAIHFLIHELLIKRLFRTMFFIPRPYTIDPNIVTIGQKMTDSSFPSGHMSVIASVLTVIIFYYPKFWPLALIFVLCLGFSRMHNGYHYLADVIFGLVFGMVYGLLAIFIFNLFGSKLAP